MDVPTGRARLTPLFGCVDLIAVRFFSPRRVGWASAAAAAVFRPWPSSRLVRVARRKTRLPPLSPSEHTARRVHSRAPSELADHPAWPPLTMALEGVRTSCHDLFMRWTYSCGLLFLVVAGCSADRTVNQAPTIETDSTGPIADSAAVSGSSATAVSTTSEGSRTAAMADESRANASTSPAEGRASTEEQSSNTTAGGSADNAADGTSNNTAHDTSDASTSNLTTGVTRCTSHDDCKANEVCVDWSTKSACGEGVCTPGIACAAPNQSVCDPNQPTYTLNENGEIVPNENPWLGRLCHDCHGLTCIASACFRCTSPP